MRKLPTIQKSKNVIHCSHERFFPAHHHSSAIWPRTEETCCSEPAATTSTMLPRLVVSASPAPAVLLSRASTGYMQFSAPVTNALRCIRPICVLLSLLLKLLFTLPAKAAVGLFHSPISTVYPATPQRSTVTWGGMKSSRPSTCRRKGSPNITLTSKCVTESLTPLHLFRWLPRSKCPGPQLRRRGSHSVASHINRGAMRKPKLC